MLLLYYYLNFNQKFKKCRQLEQMNEWRVYQTLALIKLSKQLALSRGITLWRSRSQLLVSHLVRALICKIISQKMKLCPSLEFNLKIKIEHCRTFLVAKFEFLALTVKIVARQQLHLLKLAGVIPQKAQTILNSVMKVL